MDSTAKIMDIFYIPKQLPYFNLIMFLHLVVGLGLRKLRLMVFSIKIFVQKKAKASLSL